MTRISGDWLTHPATQRVCAVLGTDVLFVGGCVRNALLDVPVSDIDLASPLLPRDVTKRAEAAGLRVVPTGVDHGTVTVVSDGIPHEVTTFRKDIETDGRRAVVRFTDDVTEDAARRDFTMNALYAKSDGTVVDPLGGMCDLHARRVRFIGTAADRIGEDYLRSLRFFRFHAWYGDADRGLDADALAAIASNLDGLPGLARERVGAEFVKLLSASDPAPSVAGMMQTGVLAVILPGADPQALAPLVHLEQELGVTPDPIRRLASLGGENVVERLRLSKSQARTLDVLRDALGRLQPPGALGFRQGALRGLDVLLLRAAMAGQGVAADDLDALKRGADAVFPLSAKDLMPDYSGPALGARLADLTERWIASDFTLTKADLLRYGD